MKTKSRTPKGIDQIPGEEVIRRVRESSDTVLLAFSGGKDCLGAWLALRDHFKVIPYHMYGIPDLEFVEESIRYYEDFFQTPILRVPHPSLYRKLANLVFCPPDRVRVLERLQLPEFDYDELRDVICDDQNVPRTTWSASGVRASDSLMRRTHFKMHGAMNWNRHVFYPVWDWNIQRLEHELRKSGVKMLVDYQLFGRSCDGIDFRFLYPIKKHFPRDYARILEWFPLAELEIKRYEYATTQSTDQN